MNRRFVFALMHLLLWLPVFGSCSEIESLSAPFVVNHQSMIVIRPLPDNGFPFDLASHPYVLLSEMEFDNESPRKIMEVYVSDAKITIISPSGKDLSFLKSLDTYLVGKGLPDKLLAFHNNIPDEAGKTLVLETTDADIREYVKNRKYSLRFKTTIDEVLSEEVEILVATRFRVVAEIWDNESN